MPMCRPRVRRAGPTANSTSNHTEMRTARVVGAVLAGLVLSSPAIAQPSHGTPPGLLKKPGLADTAPHRQTEPPPTSGHVRSFGVWLDDATAMTAAESWITVSLQRWGSPAGSGLEAPVLDFVSGVSRRVDVFATVPFSRISTPGTPPATELGTIYVGSKIVLREPEDGRLGLAVNPAVEILSDSATTGTGFSRANLVWPMSVEWRQGETRVYGSTGYFTRGAYFLSGALE